MGKIYKLYENKLERAWYDSSNIVYSECDDIENELKVVRITFKDGRTYRYEGVDVKGVGTVGLITYMRTDSLRVSEEAQKAAAAATMVFPLPTSP